MLKFIVDGKEVIDEKEMTRLLDSKDEKDVKKVNDLMKKAMNCEILIED
jgi:hypothetical protein